MTKNLTVSESQLTLLQSAAQVVATLSQELAKGDFEASHDLVDEIAARAHRIVDERGPVSAARS